MIGHEKYGVSFVCFFFLLFNSNSSLISQPNTQGGTFDNPNRLFHSISQTWDNCMTSMSDVKELIPEFFYLPEFLMNQSDLDLGTLHNGEFESPSLFFTEPLTVFFAFFLLFLCNGCRSSVRECCAT